MARNYTTEGTVAEYLGVTLTAAQQASLNALIPAVEARIDRETGRAWLGGAVVAEAHYGPFYGDTLTLNNAPIAAVTAITYRGSFTDTETALVVGTDYEVRSLTAGILWLPSYRSYDRLLISYTPATTLPADLALAATMLAAYWLQPVLTGVDAAGLKAYSVGGELSVTFKDGSDGGGDLPTSVRGLLRSYRRLVLA